MTTTRTLLLSTILALGAAPAPAQNIRTLGLPAQGRAAPTGLATPGRPLPVNPPLVPAQQPAFRGQVQVAALNWRLQFDSQDAILDAAVRGLGVAFMPDWLVKDRLLDGSLVRLFPETTAPPLQTYAVWPTMLHMPPRLRVTLDYLANNLMRG